ncbi:MAG TPA: response regulator [Verrucomicrobiae bacterium]|nr:response regulator [Verrucomicrobiae bacterium]
MVKVDIQKEFGGSVRVWRGRLGISQEELAERAGLHRTYVCDIERGARNVSLKSIEKLATALEVPLSTLFTFAAVPELEAASSNQPVPELVDILYVEDNPADADLALAALKHAKITNRIHLVRDGAEALDFLFCLGRYSERSLDQGPQVVLLDLNLPKVSGLDVLRRIRSDARTRSIAVIVLTASKSDRDVEASERLGADGYIVKPVDFRTLSEVTPGLCLQWALLKPGPAVGA